MESFQHIREHVNRKSLFSVYVGFCISSNATKAVCPSKIQIRLVMEYVFEVKNSMTLANYGKIDSGIDSGL